MTKRKWTTQPADESHQDLELPHIERKENQTHQELVLSPMKWIDLVTETRPWTATPMGPKYQADVPDWTGNRNKQENEDWLGEQIWPIQNPSQEASNGSRIGKGRRGICSCWKPGSAECVNLHVKEKRNKLKSELGEAFGRWKFDEMEEQIPKSWSSKNQKMFESLVKNNPSSKEKSFLKPALKSLPRKDRKSIISYYFNVIVLRRMSKETRSGITEIETDDEDEESEPEKPILKGSPKLSNNETSKGRYLTSLRLKSVE